MQGDGTVCSICSILVLSFSSKFIRASIAALLNPASFKSFSMFFGVSFELLFLIASSLIPLGKDLLICLASSSLSFSSNFCCIAISAELMFSSASSLVLPIFFTTSHVPKASLNLPLGTATLR